MRHRPAAGRALFSAILAAGLFPAVAVLGPPAGAATPSPTDRASLVNDPTVDGLNDTQVVGALALSRGNLVSAFRDPGVAATTNHRIGYAASTDGGASFTDRGSLPASPDGEGGNPVLASDATTGRIYLATRTRGGFNRIP